MTSSVGLSSTFSRSSARAMVLPNANAVRLMHSASRKAITALFLFKSLPFIMFPPAFHILVVGTFLPLRVFLLRSKRNGVPRLQNPSRVYTRRQISPLLYFFQGLFSIYYKCSFIHYVDIICLTYAFFKAILCTICIIWVLKSFLTETKKT